MYDAWTLYRICSQRARFAWEGMWNGLEQRGVQPYHSFPNAPTPSLHPALRPQIAAHCSKDHDGYISESQEGLVLASFRDPAQALVWALTTQQALLNAPWDPELLVGRGEGRRRRVGDEKRA